MRLQSQSVPRLTEGLRVAAPCWARYLLDVSLCEGKLGGDVEHDLPLPEHSEDRLGSCLAVSHIQASTEAARQWTSGGGEEVLEVYFSFVKSNDFFLFFIFALIVPCNILGVITL